MNPLYPPEMQINCPQFGWCGLGYLGFDTTMCFICEHQWTPDESVGVSTLSTAADADCIAGVAVKRCPKCSAAIEKNGGCDHMTCRCGYEFWWTTLKSYRS